MASEEPIVSGMAGRYATALFELALEQGQIDVVRSELDRFEAFASFNGPAFYRLPVNEGRVTLRREKLPVPDHVSEGQQAVAPFRAGEALRWRFV